MAKLKVIFDAEISRAKAALAALRKDTSKTKREIERPVKGDFSGMVSAAKSAAAKIKGFLVGAMATLGVSVGVGAIKDLATRLDSIGKTSRNLGVSAEELQKLTYAAESVNFPVEQLNMVFTKVRQTVGDAARGVQSAEDKLAAIGLRSQDLVKLRPYEQFQKIAEAIRTIPNDADRAAAAVALFGEQGVKMTNFLNEFESLGNDLAAKGAIIPDQAIADAETFTQQITNIQRILQSWTVNSGLLSQLVKLAEGLEALGSNDARMKSAGIRSKFKDEHPVLSAMFTAGRHAWNGLGGLVGMGWAWGDKGLGDILMPEMTDDLTTDPAPSRAERDKMRKAQLAAAEQRKKEAEEREALRQQAKADRLAKTQKEQQEKGDKSVRDRIEEMNKKLRYQQLINNGLAKEAAILQEIDAAEKAAGRQLTDTEKNDIRNAAGLMFDLRQKDQAKADTVARTRPKIYSDSLLRMGGRIGGIGSASADYPRKSFDRLGEIRDGLKSIREKMNTTGTIRFN